MKKHGFLLLCMWLFLAAATSAEQAKCHKVRLADIGWTDVSATTAVTAQLLEWLGYQPQISLYSMPVALKGLSSDDIDVFLGNWMPTQKADVTPYLEQKAFVQLVANLRHAKFSLAVPEAVYEAGVHSVADLQRFADRFEHKIYGIEAGNDGNRQIMRMIGDNAFSLKGFSLVESSEQAMLAAVRNAIRDGDFIVFLAWEPHPMNSTMKLRYLEGAEAYFGSNFGEATVYTLVRKNLEQDCPELTAFFKRLQFTTQQENVLMELILEKHLSPKDAARTWLLANLDFAKQIFEGLKNYKGEEAEVPLQADAQALEAKAQKLMKTKIPLGAWAEEGVENINEHFSSELNAFSSKLERGIQAFIALLFRIPAYVVVALLALLVYYITCSYWLPVGTLAGLALIVNLGLWQATLQTLVLVAISTVCSALIGIPIGILCGHRPRLYRFVAPVLDLMQTVPTFVYLIPTLILFGLGVVPGVISTIIFVMPAAIRLSCLGIRQVPKELREAGLAFGATRMQLLRFVELPHARATIIEGISQSIMLSLSMVVVAALVGADGLGNPVVRALNTVNIGLGFDAAVAIVIVAVLLDRIVRHGRKTKKGAKK